MISVECKMPVFTETDEFISTVYFFSFFFVIQWFDGAVVCVLLCHPPYVHLLVVTPLGYRD